MRALTSYCSIQCKRLIARDAKRRGLQSVTAGHHDGVIGARVRTVRRPVALVRMVHVEEGLDAALRDGLDIL